MLIELIAETVVSGVAAGGATWLVLTYLGKTLLTQQLAKELDQHRLALNEQLATFQLALQKDLHKFSVEISRLDQQRTTGVMELHGLMCDIEQLVVWNSGSAATGLISVDPELRTMAALNQAWEAIPELNRKLGYFSLLLNDDVCARVDKWSKKMLQLIASIGNDVEQIRQHPDNARRSRADREQTIVEIRDKYMDALLYDIGAERKALGEEFKKVLGVSQ